MDQTSIALTTIRRQTSAPTSDDQPLNVSDEDPIMQPVTKKTQALVLLAAFSAVFLTIGFNQGFGVFQEYYTSSENTLLPASEAQNSAFIAFTGTLGTGLTWAGGIFVSPLLARGTSARKVSFAGVVIISLAFGLASLASRTWQLLLTQGLLYGIGSSLLYFPTVSVAPEYFDGNRGAAMGIVLSGAGVGGLCLSPLIRFLLTRIGVRWTLRFLAMFNFVVGTPIALIARSSRSTTRRPTLVNLSIAMKPAFVFQTMAAFLQAGGNLVPLTFSSSFSGALGYTAANGAVLLGLSNGVNTIARIAMGFVADRFGRQNTLVLSVAGSAISVLVLWLYAATEASKGFWIAFIVFYGILAGGYNALLPTTIAEVFGVQAYASINAFIYFIRGLGAMFGSPVGGVILRSSTKAQTREGSSSASYLDLIWYDGSLLLACSLCVIAVRGFDALDKKAWKWKA